MATGHTCSEPLVHGRRALVDGKQIAMEHSCYVCFTTPVVKQLLIVIVHAEVQQEEY